MLAGILVKKCFALNLSFPLHLFGHAKGGKPFLHFFYLSNMFVLTKLEN